MSTTKKRDPAIEDLWDVERAAAYLGVKVQSRDNMITALRILGVPRLKIGGRVRYVPRVVREWAESQRG